MRSLACACASGQCGRKTKPKTDGRRRTEQCVRRTTTTTTRKSGARVRTSGPKTIHKFQLDRRSCVCVCLLQDAPLCRILMVQIRLLYNCGRCVCGSWPFYLHSAAAVHGPCTCACHIIMNLMVPPHCVAAATATGRQRCTVAHTCTWTRPFSSFQPRTAPFAGPLFTCGRFRCWRVGVMSVRIYPRRCYSV